MFALAYDTAMRREELCTLDNTDLQPGKRLVRIRAEHTRRKSERTGRPLFRTNRPAVRRLPPRTTDTHPHARSTVPLHLESE